MSTLYVIRHGQASFGKADYDELTPLGVEQSRRLGRWLVDSGVRIDRMWAGPRRRQRDTARHMIEGAGGRLPEPEAAPGLDEYPAELVMRLALPQLLESDDEARQVFGGDPLGVPTDARRFQKVFERVMSRWVAGGHEFEGAESFGAFAARVRAAYADIMAAAGRGTSIAVVTSAGPTSVACQLALELSDAAVLKVSWVVANSGLAELRFADGELALVSFNSVPHLPRDLVTYR